jgi:outer membrane protein OmpA-like peptidoglycan-associated protein
MMPGTVGRQTASYRQGLVLGLTMAELMLLLVFCLLIALGVALATERAKRDDAIQRLKIAELAAASQQALLDPIKRNARLAELVERTVESGSAREIDEFWRKLVDSEEIVEALERQGVSRTALREDGTYFAKMQQLQRNGINPDQVTRGAALASAIDKLLVDSPSARTPEELAALVEKSVSATKRQGDHDRNGHTWPPIINLSEADGYFFATRSAELTADFAAKLRTAVVDRLVEIGRSFDVDVIEVIGHTDERPVASGLSNLDRELSSVISGASDVGQLQPADNAGLGLARAVAVVKVLSAEPRLSAFRILPLSGAQLVGTDGRLTRWDERGDVRELRRIEIRMRKSN